MGIPSYYKRLIDRFPKLVQKGIRKTTSDVLLMDFNCLIYQCVRSDSLPVFTADKRDDWERALIEAVKTYTVNVWTTAGRPTKVLIAVDGVVPMAKIRQQRMRRFKSRWLAAAELAAGVRKPGEESWDTNAITPGTEFMEKLGRGLQSLATARGGGWEVSTASEPGEGEQKVMAWVRSHAAELTGKSVLVYGLDADLIVLSLLSVARHVPGVASWKLLRELAEFEGGKQDGGVFGTLDICDLLKTLVPSAMTPAEYMLEYVCGMSFLGNDFLPHSLSVKMREGGHEMLCRALTEMHENGVRLVGADEKVLGAGILGLVHRWVFEEEGWMGENFSHKYKMRPMPPRNDRERLMATTERLPLEWMAESAIWSAERGFVEGWRDVYREKWLHGAHGASSGRVSPRAPVDCGLLLGEASELFVVFSVECAASLGGLGCTSSWRTRSDCGSSDIAGGSTGAAGDGFTDGFLVASARAAAAGPACEAAGVLACAVRVFLCRTAMAVGM